MLPSSGTRERAQLEAEACTVALQLLDREYLEISTALHKTFMHFRAKFLSERDLLDAHDQGEAWSECVIDARQVAAFVNDVWAASIRKTSL